MIGRIDKHIISETPNISERFAPGSSILHNARGIDKEFENVIWNTLKTKGIISHYTLSKDKFQHFEEIEFAENHSLVANQLQALKGTSKKVVLIWNAKFNAVLLDFDVFVDNWEDFFYPSSDDLFIISETLDWIIYMAHFECYYFGKGLKEKLNELYYGKS